MNCKYYLFLPIIFAVFISNAFADDQVPGVVVAVEGDPYYFSEDNFGIKILKYFERSLEPYLVPGITTEQSSVQEISEAYQEANQHLSQKVIVSDENRGGIFVVHFSGGEIPSPQTFTSFSKFTHLKFDTGNPSVPKNQQYISNGLELESLPSKDKEPFYRFLVSEYINGFYSAEAFDVTVDVLTGDGHILQKSKYSDCKLISYYSFLDENLGKLKFVGEFVSEIREKSSFECDGYLVDFELKEPAQPPETLLKLSDFIPDDDSRATSFVVSFSGGEITKAQSSFTFSKFVPVTAHDSFPRLHPGYTIGDKSQITLDYYSNLSTETIPGYTIGDKPQFTLESLPSEDKEQYYQFISKYLNAGKDPEPFDVTVKLVTGDNTILQSWEYSKCDATSYTLFYLDNLLFYKFKQTYGSEIREKAFFECSGLSFAPTSDEPSSEEPQVTSNAVTLIDDQRAQTFVVHMQGTEISPAQTSYTFTKFSHITNEDLPILLPNAPFDSTPKFYLESLPSKDKEWLYKLASMYINPGKIPEQFEVTIDVLTGNGSILQKWDYSKCDIIDYRPILTDSLVTRMFTEQFQPEIRDRTIFSCAGISLNPQIDTSEPKKTRPIDFIPEDKDRAMAFTVELSGGEFQRPFVIHSFDDFEFTEKERASPAPYSHEQFEYGLELGSLPSKDKKEFYKLVNEYYSFGKDPEPFDVKVDILTGDGTILQTWDYAKCDIENYKTFLFDNLLFYKGHGGRGSEIRDNTVFDCVGFAVDFTTRDSSKGIQSFVPSYEDRAIIYILHISGGELTHTRSTELMQKFNSMGNQEFLLESLPSKQQKVAYDFISRYINAGKVPELFDVQVDMITGDGTILYTIDYSKCGVTNYAVHLNDNMGSIKFLPQMKSEIREKGILDCTGVHGIVLPDKSPNSRWHVPPLTQTTIGIPANEVVCKENFELMMRPPSGTAACVKEDSTTKLEQRGWEKASQSDVVSSKIKTIVPTQEERAMSFVAHFQGSEIAPAQTSYTFSNFSPITNNESNILKPDNPLNSSSKQFYLESLPSKDKEWLYELASMYINPGKVPELFEVTIEMVSGDGELLQTWKYGKCEITNYDVYLEDGLLNYKFHERWQSEIRDRTIFDCGGLKFRTT